MFEHKLYQLPQQNTSTNFVSWKPDLTLYKSLFMLCAQVLSIDSNLQLISITECVCGEQLVNPVTDSEGHNA